MDDEQGENLDRVNQRIGWVILMFYHQRKEEGRPVFLAADLRAFVVKKIGPAVAPASPDRILRDLRQRHLLDYRVVSRSQSLYEFVWADQLELL